MFTFSSQLRQECIVYFKEICGVLIDDEKADLYLESLANLFEAMENISDNQPF